jgi:hypothetical protein
MATARCIVNQSVSLLRNEFSLYAGSMKETTNGYWRCACGEAGKALEVIVERCIAQDGKLNESKPVAEASEDEAGKIAEEKALLGQASLLLHCRHRLS